ncbi:MAG: hypothetical protein K2Y32_14740 [Candidatus Obscuribacterales bacterium]|nr:hypothetical protein [Candidatus Obscuribacterales bacterium]
MSAEHVLTTADIESTGRIVIGEVGKALGQSFRICDRSRIDSDKHGAGHRTVG